MMFDSVEVLGAEKRCLQAITLVAIDNDGCSSETFTIEI